MFRLRVLENDALSLLSASSCQSTNGGCTFKVHIVGATARHGKFKHAMKQVICPAMSIWRDGSVAVAHDLPHPFRCTAPGYQIDHSTKGPLCFVLILLRSMAYNISAQMVLDPVLECLQLHWSLAPSVMHTTTSLRLREASVGSMTQTGRTRTRAGSRLVASSRYTHGRVPISAMTAESYADRRTDVSWSPISR